MRDGLSVGYICTVICSVDLNLWDLKDVREVPENQDGEASLPSLSKLLCRVSMWDPLPSPFYIVERKEATESWSKQ